MLGELCIYNLSKTQNFPIILSDDSRLEELSQSEEEGSNTSGRDGGACGSARAGGTGGARAAVAAAGGGGRTTASLGVRGVTVVLALNLRLDFGVEVRAAEVTMGRHDVEGAVDTVERAELKPGIC